MFSSLRFMAFLALIIICIEFIFGKPLVPLASTQIQLQPFVSRKSKAYSMGIGDQKYPCYPAGFPQSPLYDAGFQSISNPSLSTSEQIELEPYISYVQQEQRPCFYPLPVYPPTEYGYGTYFTPPVPPPRPELAYGSYIESNGNFLGVLTNFLWTIGYIFDNIHVEVADDDENEGYAEPDYYYDESYSNYDNYNDNSIETAAYYYDNGNEYNSDSDAGSIY